MIKMVLVENAEGQFPSKRVCTRKRHKTQVNTHYELPYNIVLVVASKDLDKYLPYSYFIELRHTGRGMAGRIPLTGMSTL